MIKFIQVDKDEAFPLYSRHDMPVYNGEGDIIGTIVTDEGYPISEDQIDDVLDSLEGDNYSGGL